MKAYSALYHFIAPRAQSAVDTRRFIADINKDPEVIDYLVKYDEKVQFNYDEIQGLNDQELKEKILQICRAKKEHLAKKREEIEKIVEDVDRALKELNVKSFFEG